MLNTYFLTAFSNYSDTSVKKFDNPGETMVHFSPFISASYMMQPLEGAIDYILHVLTGVSLNGILRD